GRDSSEAPCRGPVELSVRTLDGLVVLPCSSHTRTAEGAEKDHEDSDSGQAPRGGNDDRGSLACRSFVVGIGMTWSPTRRGSRGMAGIELDDVGKVYQDGTRAVSDFSLDIGDGEFVVLVGPSGCGKTTAL